ncbi:hypothetical protein A2856_02150 [Candidatus Uhrbacteria bacterium RIFCSPHIGHO2_01_FULL_63_20]|uniref:Rod shape-determining protein MreD n=1 Tax=Candidatus Uhrbacteria bacterium RIFCSPHIGHO2_01_FULL_63_20 TaxID=1802385 RepID=A0A1F7TKG3_9BACT|nr:MAG: hypothetical protein A2856_02150 [Candidatus Uhrbacteria bacterium RIFCSPHIGHO2_01_FULL_63_20]
MIRYATSGVVFLALFLAERAFIASLPAPFAAAPLVLAAGVYAVQHLSLPDGVAWILLGGIASDALALTPFPYATASSVAASACAVSLSRSVFTNRSIYGILACGSAAIVAKALAGASVLAVLGLGGPGSGWFSPIAELPLALALGVLSLALLFRFAKRIRRMLSSIVMVTP